MKKAILLTHELSAEADAATGRIGVALSKLYAAALAEYLVRFRGIAVTERLNVVYALAPGPGDAAVQASTLKSLGRASW